MPAAEDTKNGGRLIVFAAPGVRHTVGGIAASSRNVELALRDLAAKRGLGFRTHVIGEVQRPEERSEGYLAHGDSKSRFAMALLPELLRARLAVFAHVRLALPVLALPQPLRPKIVIFAHGSESWRRVRALSRHLFRSADLVCTNSSYTLRNMQQTFTGFEGRVCELGLPADYSRPQQPAMDSCPLKSADGVDRALGPRAMLHVGRMHSGEREKGQRELIAAMPLIAQRIPEAQLVLVGDGTDRPGLQALASESSARAQIFLPGEVPDSTLAYLYSASYAFVMPSRQEGFGLVYLEAMACGKPCIACHDDGGAEVVVDGETGILVSNPPRVEDLARTCIELMTKPDWAARLGEAGRQRLLSRFTARDHVERVMTCVEPLLGDGLETK
jgi:phosphatidylinositol alpha-1,6-mannosyltransferase